MSNVPSMRRLAAALLGVALLATPSSADAGDTPMTASGGRQDGSLMYAADYRGDGRYCAGTLALGTGIYPAPVRHDGSALTWLVEDPRRPALASVTRSIGVLPASDVRSDFVATTLEPVRRRGKTVAWLVRTGPVGYGDLRLTFTVKWPEDECGADYAVRRYRALSLPV